MRRRFGYGTKSYLWKENPWRFQRLLAGTAALSAARTGLIHVREQSPGSPQQGQAAHHSAGHRAAPRAGWSHHSPAWIHLSGRQSPSFSNTSSSIQSRDSGWGAESTLLGSTREPRAISNTFQADKRLPAAPPPPAISLRL